MNRARFPARPVNKHNQQKQIVSYSSRVTRSANKRDTTTELTNSQEFHGFQTNDTLRSECNKKRSDLSTILTQLTTKDKDAAADNKIATRSRRQGSSHGATSLMANETTVRSTRKRKISLPVALQSKSREKKVKNVAPESEQRRSRRGQSGSQKELTLTPEQPAMELESDYEISPSLDKVLVQLETEGLQNERRKAKVLKPDPLVAELLYGKRSKVTEVKTLKSEDEEQNKALTNGQVSLPLSLSFFQGKEEYVAAVLFLVDREVEKAAWLKQERVLVQCGVCLDISPSANLASQRKHDCYLCARCTKAYRRVERLAKLDKALTCNGTGNCDIEPHLEESICDACFVRNCLLMMELGEDVYTSMFNSVPKSARNFCPPKPPVVKRYENRGKILFVDKGNGDILGKYDSLTQVRFKPETLEALEVTQRASEREEKAPIGMEPESEVTKAAESTTNGGAVDVAAVVTEVDVAVALAAQPKKKMVKRLLPNDKESEMRVLARGARVKHVTRTWGDIGRPQPATFGDMLALNEHHFKGLLSKGQEMERIGSRIAEQVGNGTNGSAEQIGNASGNPDKANEESAAVEKGIKVNAPLPPETLEEEGFPVLVVDGDWPRSPLCFACGSGGSNQLVFCCSCSEPFHPYCSHDQRLLSFFLNHYVNTTTKTKTRETLSGQFLHWKCHRCLLCSECSQPHLPQLQDKGLDDFVQCQECHDHYHLGCAKKTSLTSTLTSESPWICKRCLKCSSCCSLILPGHLQKLRNLQNRKALNGGGQEVEMLCLECLKGRQKGSFCPVCLQCYDDNDWDSKMMECDLCKRWIHARCEELGDEQYNVLSSLPESIPYVCRLCVPGAVGVGSGWREAVINELSDSCIRALDYFQKKVVGMSRKRRMLTFDLEDLDPDVKVPQICPTDMSYFSPSVLIKEQPFRATSPLPSPVKCPIQESPTPQTTPTKDSKEPTDLWIEGLKRKFGIRECSVTLHDLDHTNQHHNDSFNSSTSSTCSTSGSTCTSTHSLFGELPVSTISLMDTVKINIPDPSQIETTRIGEMTPTKRPLELISTPCKVSTPCRVVTSFTQTIKSTQTLWTSVQDFYKLCLKLLPSHFEELANRDSTDSSGSSGSGGQGQGRYEGYLEDAVKQVFPWFEVKVQSQELPTEPEKVDVELALENEDPSSAIPEVKRPLEPLESLPVSVVFEDIPWDPEVLVDRRLCLLCSSQGDLPLNSSGRLLYLGPSQWIHVNCAIWSSEVWEEDSGSLQQVDGALTRGKKTKCSRTKCSLFGATLNCCASSCRRCYHFKCAIGEGCALMQDKTVFCPVHSVQAKGQLQLEEEMHVTRKVYVDPLTFGLTLQRKKEVKLMSNQLKIFVGSMRIDRLGHIVPISLNEGYLTPVGYEVKRIYLRDNESPQKYNILSLRTQVNREGDVRALFNQGEPLRSYSVTVDHSSKGQRSRMKMDEVQQFTEWVRRAPRFVDEFGMEWMPPCYPEDSKETIKGTGRAKIEWTIDSNDPDESENIEFDLRDLGLLHPGVQFLTEQLPGIENISPLNYKFHFVPPYIPPEDTLRPLTSTGSARSDGFSHRKPFDMFSWLKSSYRQPPTTLIDLESKSKGQGLPIAMRFRNLKERASRDLVVLPSLIHGRGLFSRRDMEVGEMLIEYAGEVIRSALCDLRERKYELGGIGCYMFRVNRDIVVDATMKGNAARFINHSCDPNCESKSVKIQGKDHILIFALRNIGRGEELTYDYKFEREKDKLPCSCGAKRCRRTLN